MRAITAFACAAALTFALAPGARADENDRLTYMTFSGPVQVPGATLPAGTYTFKLADVASSRHIVQIFNKGDNKLITTVMTIPNDRIDPVKDTLVMFAERPAGTPVAVKAWFYPGRSIGEEFMYPRKQATQIAKQVHEAVLTTQGDETTTTGATARVNDQGSVTAEESRSAKNAPAPTTTTASNARVNEPTTTARSRASAPPAPVPEPTTTAQARNARSASVGTSGATAERNNLPARLPQTASPLALMELLSGLSLAGGFGLRQLRRRA